MKNCSKCGEEKPFSEFNKKRGGLQSYCRSCNSDKLKLFYLDNRSRSLALKRIREIKLKFEVEQIKTASGCMDCKVTYPEEPWLLEFDHTGDDKESSVSNLMARGHRKRTLDEISKCEVVCLICHRRRTASRGGWKCETAESSTSTPTPTAKQSALAGSTLP